MGCLHASSRVDWWKASHLHWGLIAQREKWQDENIYCTPSERRTFFFVKCWQNLRVKTIQCEVLRVQEGFEMLHATAFLYYQSNSTSLRLPRGSFSVLRCKVKMIYINFSLIASPDVRKLRWCLTGCGINYWSLNIRRVLLSYSCGKSFISWWLLTYRDSNFTGQWPELFHTSDLLRKRRIGRNNKQVHMIYLVPLFS